MNGFLGVRPEDRRIIWTAFATLLVIVGSHAVLETARDSLFLADLPASRLPWAYLGIAVLAFVAARGLAGVLAGRSARLALSAMLIVGAAGTGALWEIVGSSSPVSLMALYIWTGVLASLVVSQFWIQLGAQMDVGQAKRGYAVIAAGGMLGATLGSALATAALTVTAPRNLVGLAAVLFAISSCAPVLSRKLERARGTGPAPPAPVEEEGPTLRSVWVDPYLKRLLLLAIMGPVIAMGIDFIFKSVVTHQLPRAALAPFFARYNTIVNAAALAFQLLLAPRLLQSFGVVRNLCILPGCLGVAAAGVAGTAGLPAALVLRGTDGVLRHSLHRAATEILFLPLSPSARSALRRLAESIGQRGGQVVGSGIILLVLALGATPRELSAGVAVLCGLWLFGYVRLREHYVERFRSQLGVLNATPDAAIPELDLQSLETLVATLSATKDAEVLAALDLLETYGRTRLISSLILYHPSTAVVLRALRLFEGTRRSDLREIRRRLLEHRDPAVRAAALRSVASDGAERAIVRTLLRTDPSPVVRCTALILWMGFADTPEADLTEAVADVVALPDPEARLVVARALGEVPARVLQPLARTLLANATPAVRREVARAVAKDPDAGRMAFLTELVAVPECRPFARAGLRALGAPALEHLAGVLAKSDTPAAIRRHVPRSISAFGSARAAELLVRQLSHEQDGRAIHKILRGLGRLRADHPSVPVDASALMAVAEHTLARMIAMLAYRVAWDVWRKEPTPHDEDIVVKLLGEKEQRGLEQVCRVLQILETDEDFATIYAALRSDVPATRAGARELIGHVLTGGCRDGLLALTDSLPPPERLQAAARALAVPLADRALAAWQTSQDTAPATDAEDAAWPVVQELCRDRSVVLASVARYAANIPTPPDGSMEVHRVAS